MSTARPKDHRLLAGPIAPTLLRFSLPLLTTNLLHTISGTWAAVWVSHQIGPNALTAVANATIFMWMMMGGVMGFGLAGGIAIGQSIGAGDPRGIKRVVGTVLSSVFGFSVLLALVGWFATPWLLDTMRIPAAARELSIVNLRLTFLTMLSLFSFLVLMMMMRGAGDARTPFRFSLLWIGLNFALMPALLAPPFGWPSLGIASVGVANLVSNAVALVAMATYVYRNRMPLALRGAELRHLRPDPKVLAMLARRGAPMALENFIVQGAYFALLSMVNGYGAETAAAYSGAAQLWGYVQMPAMAVSAGMSAMAAMNIGARQWPRVERIALEGCVLSAGLTAGCALLAYLLGDRALALFLPDGGSLLAIAREINWIVLWGWIAISISSGLAAVVRANAAMAAPTVIFALTMWGLRVPFAALLQPALGAAAIWWSFPVGTVGSALLAVAYYRWGRWRDNAPIMSNVHDESAAPPPSSSQPPPHRAGDA